MHISNSPRYCLFIINNNTTATAPRFLFFFLRHFEIVLNSGNDYDFSHYFMLCILLIEIILKNSTNADLSQLSISAWNIDGLGDKIEDHIYIIRTLASSRVKIAYQENLSLVCKNTYFIL
jgi:hypothetical protein